MEEPGVFCFLAMHGLQTRCIYFMAALLLWFTTYPMKPATAAKATLVPVFLSQWSVWEFTQFLVRAD